ncbi:hypothetical protein Hanom_Chr13g01207311 [Helianthus anomalus]
MRKKNRRPKKLKERNEDLKLAVSFTEDDESEEEEDEIVYGNEEGGEFSPQHLEWFKKERKNIPDFYQVVTVENTEATDKIISWKYCDMKGMFILKQRGGVIQHFKTGLDMQSLPRWHTCEIGGLGMINPTHRSIGVDFEILILRECMRRFTIFKSRHPRRRVSKTTKVPITRKGKVTCVIDLAKVVTKIRIPLEHPVALTNFKKSFYDGKSVKLSSDRSQTNTFTF